MEQLAYNVTNVQITVLDTDKAAEDGLSAFSGLDESLKDLQVLLEWLAIQLTI